MKTIVHTCSSILVRPNGIVRYINSVIDIQRMQGNNVIFVTDAKPSQTINADKIYYLNNTSTYAPDVKDDHVWLQIDSKIIQDITTTLKNNNITYDLIVAHDLHSYLAVEHLHEGGIFVQHEADVMNQDVRVSYVSDEYLKKQIHIVNTTNWRVGLPALSSFIKPTRPVYTPPPFRIKELSTSKKDKGLLYIGDDSDRKGAKQFVEFVEKYQVDATVISHSPNTNLFGNIKVQSFNLDEQDAMLNLMARHRAAFIPSKNECFSLAVLECLQFMPVVVDSKYGWTNGLEKIGVNVVTGNDLDKTILHLLCENEYTYKDRRAFETWAFCAEQIWRNIGV